MSLKTCGISSIALALFAASAYAFAAKEAQQATHDGVVVSITANQLVMTAKGSTDGKEHTHTLAPDAAFTLDGKACKSADLKAGMKIRVSTSATDKAAATAVEAIHTHETFANTHDGKLVSMKERTFVMTGQDGKEHSHTLATNATVTCDGKPCQMSELKAGMKIRVTTKATESGTATEIEALNKNLKFA